MKYLVLTMRGPDFDPDVLPAHYRFLDDLRERGLLQDAGPFTDGTGGAYILKADSLSEAMSRGEQDPLVTRNCSAVTVKEWNSGI